MLKFVRLTLVAALCAVVYADPPEGKAKKNKKDKKCNECIEDLEIDVEDLKNLYADLLARMIAVEGQAQQNKLDIKENKDNIKENKDQRKLNDIDIKANKDAIKENKLAIKANDADIKANKLAIKDNKLAIKANDVDIKDNKDAIKVNKLAIKANDVDIKDNKDAIKVNKLAIKDNKDDIKVNRLAIKDNKEDIKTNKLAIKDNKDERKLNDADIRTNKQAINALKNRVTAVEDFQAATDVIALDYFNVNAAPVTIPALANTEVLYGPWCVADEQTIDLQIVVSFFDNGPSSIAADLQLFIDNVLVATGLAFNDATAANNSFIQQSLIYKKTLTADSIIEVRTRNYRNSEIEIQAMEAMIDLKVWEAGYSLSTTEPAAACPI